MNQMRFGALLVAMDWQLGFYLSHRVILTVPYPGCIRAVPPDEFGKCKVFARNGVAVSFFSAMMSAANTEKKFRNSFEMAKFFLNLPEKFDTEDLCQYMEHRYGAVMEDFTVKTIAPETDDNVQQWRRIMESYDAQTEFNSKYEEARAKFGKRPNILVCGYTGSGKSSLVKAILGDIVPDSAIGDGAPKTMGYDCYENDLVRIWDSKGLELGETEEAFTSETRDFVRSRQNNANVDEHVHLVWYTIQGPGARVTDCDKNLIQNIFNPEHVIVVVTKNDVTRQNQRETLKQVIIDAGIPAEHILFTSDEEGGSQGCKELMNLSYSMLPDAYKDAFMEAQRIDMEAKKQAVYGKSGKASVIIAAATTAAAAAGAIPIPLSDAAILVPVQVTMIGTLAGLYGLKEEAVKQSAWPFVARLAGVFLASSLLKFIPGLGSAINAAVAGTLTGAMGLYVKHNFEASAIAKIEGRPAPDLGFDVELFKKFYAEYKKNKGAN
ncbi:MAG: 50S ribosome-binding GTPase [Alphaproteobacteria bacterium]|nr:50S ribosome-binding GTPase [Alphaproteobacteria bacterium]